MVPELYFRLVVQKCKYKLTEELELSIYEKG